MTMFRQSSPDGLGEKSFSSATYHPRARLRWIRFVVLILALVLVARSVAIEVFYGAEYRAAALAPRSKSYFVRAPRGRILARDGTILAEDRSVAALFMHYRLLEDPPDEAWLNRRARLTLPQNQRRNEAALLAARNAVLAERDALHRTVAELCGLSLEELRARMNRVQVRVERISRHVNERRIERQAAVRVEEEPAPRSFWEHLSSWARSLVTPRDPPSPAPPIVVAEMTQDHWLYDGLTAEAVSEIEDHPEQFQGIRLVARFRREYPLGRCMSHVVGYVQSPRKELREELTPDDFTQGATLSTRQGVLGVEEFQDRVLRGEDGLVVETSGATDEVLSREFSLVPRPGVDFKLSIDPGLQREARDLLQSTIVSSRDSHELVTDRGGSVIVMDVRQGELLVLASWPDFDPDEQTQGMQDSLAEDSGSYFHRAVAMAIPPGSVFKVVTAAALLDAGVSPDQSVYCQGYLRQSDRDRCLLFQQFGVGHGDMTVVDALCQSCNVYFFHHANRLGAGPILDWSDRFGLSQRTGVDLPREAPGQLLSIKSAEAGDDEASTALRAARIASLDANAAQAISIGQGELAVTPLQIARLFAAIANQGELVTPHVVLSASAAANLDAAPFASPPEKRQVPGLKPFTTGIIAQGLKRAVADPLGSGHLALHMESLAVAGKTGTAETGKNQTPHSWFAGYFPADHPQYVIVVAIEHGGSGAEVAANLAREVIERVVAAGYVSAQ